MPLYKPAERRSFSYPGYKKFASKIGMIGGMGFIRTVRCGNADPGGLPPAAIIIPLCELDLSIITAGDEVEALRGAAEALTWVGSRA